PVGLFDQLLQIGTNAIDLLHRQISHDDLDMIHPIVPLPLQQAEGGLRLADPEACAFAFIEMADPQKQRKNPQNAQNDPGPPSPGLNRRKKQTKDSWTQGFQPRPPS